MKRFILLFLFSLALILRSINFPQTINFSSDQGEHLLESAKILNGEPIKLIGVSVSSKLVGDKYFFIGFQYLYFLAFCQWLVNYDPIGITFVFTVLNSLAVCLVFIVSNKWFGKKAALISAFIYATNPFAINYSKIIWNPTLQPVLFSLVLFLLSRKRGISFGSLLVCGVIMGLLFSIEYSSIILAPIVVGVLWCLERQQKNHRLVRYLSLTIGFVLGISNLIIFDLRHHFYNSTLMLKYYLTNSSGLSTGLGIHHLLPLLPIIFILLGFLLLKIPTKIRLFSIGLILCVQLVLVWAYLFKTNSGFRMSQFTSYPDFVRASELISNDEPKSFNVAQTIDGGIRANALRYLLTYRFNQKSELLKYDQYKDSKVLYVLHYLDQDISTGGPYELSSFSYQRKTEWSVPLNDKLTLSKFSRLP